MPVNRGERRQQRHVWNRAADMLQGDFGSGQREQLVAIRGDQLVQPELVLAPGRVDQHRSAGAQAVEQVDLMQQRRVLDDQRVRLHDRLAQTDRCIANAAESHHRRAHALRAEAREGLRMTTFEERGDREHLGAGYDALTAPPMNPYLQHCLLRGPRPGAIDRSAQSHFEQDSEQNSLASWQSCGPER